MRHRMAFLLRIFTRLS